MTHAYDYRCTPRTAVLVYYVDKAMELAAAMAASLRDVVVTTDGV